MQAQVRISPLANSAGDYQPWFDVTERLRGLKVSQRTTKSKWSVGLLHPSLDTFSLRNTDSLFSAASYGSSIFSAAGVDRCRVEIRYPQTDRGTDYQIIYRGQLSSKGSRENMSGGRKSVWYARSPDIAFVDHILPAGLITTGMTVREAIAAVFTDRNIAAAFPNGINLDNYYDPNIAVGGTIISNEEALLGDDRRADLVLQKLLLVGDNILTYVPYRQEARIMRRGESNTQRDDGFFPTPWSSGYIDDPLKITSIDDGVESVYNQVSCQTGLPGTDATFEIENQGSIDRYGLRKLSLDLTWCADIDQVGRIAINLLRRLSSPQKLVELHVPSLRPSKISGYSQIYGQEAIVGGLVGVHIDAKGKRDAARYDSTARYGGARYSEIIYPAIKGNFYIQEISRDLKTDTTMLVLRQFIEI